MARDPTALDRDLIAAHGGSDWRQLIGLHIEAADVCDRPEEVRFHLTQAWVFSLVSGDADVTEHLEARLRSLGGL